MPTSKLLWSTSKNEATNDGKTPQGLRKFWCIIEMGFTPEIEDLTPIFLKETPVPQLYLMFILKTSHEHPQTTMKKPQCGS